MSARDAVVEVKPVGADEAPVVHAVVHAAFEARPPLDPPAAALTETLEQLEARLAVHGGLLARVDGEPAGALVLDPVGSTMYLRRFGVVPDACRATASPPRSSTRRSRPPRATTTSPSSPARSCPPRSRSGSTRASARSAATRPNVELRRPLRTAVFKAPDAEAMRGLGRSVAGQLAPGDLIVLTGSLGAGKTTFTQGLGAGLGVRGAVTSPTFVIARVHPSEVGGPALVHVDAYRLGGVAELDDLDLDTSLDARRHRRRVGRGAGRGALRVAARGQHRPHADDDELAPGRAHPGRPALARPLLPGARMTLVVAHVSDTHFGGPPDARARAERGPRAPAGDGPAPRRPRWSPATSPTTASRRSTPRRAPSSTRWPGPKLVGTGNHDVREEFARGLLDREADGPLVQVLEAPASGFVMLDSLVPAPRRASGSTTASSTLESLAWLDEQLGRRRRARRSSCLHHPPVDLGLGADGADPAARPRAARAR